MTRKILQFDKSKNRCIDLAKSRLEREDYLGALGYLFWAERIEPDCSTYMQIANCYSEMGLLDLANKYLFKFLYVAPKEKLHLAYGELAINYFYLDNHWAAAYYFYKHNEACGYLLKDGMDEEVYAFYQKIIRGPLFIPEAIEDAILEQLVGGDFKRREFRIVYPFDKADFSPESKHGKRAMASGSFDQAISSLSSIPSLARSEEVSGDLATAYFMTDQLEKAELVCRESLKNHGESVTAYCNLSTIYDLRKDFDNSEYYYQKALKNRTGEKTEPYKIATCAIERADHLTVKECLDKIFEERPYEIAMRFFYGIALINLGEYQRAVQTFKTIMMTDPTDSISEYYFSIAKALENNDKSVQRLLPLKYLKELPKKVEKEYTTTINELYKNPQKISSSLKNPQTLKKIEWGILHGNENLVRTCVYIFGMANATHFNKFALTALINPETNEWVKRLLIYALIVSGYIGKIGVSAGCYYCSFTRKKLVFEKEIDGELFLSAYALSVSRACFYNVEDFDVLAKKANLVYSVMKGHLNDVEFNNEELAGLILKLCKFKNFNDEQIVKIFKISKTKLKKLYGYFSD